MPSEKEYNELAARLARLETLLQDNDAFKFPGDVTIKDLEFGPGLDFSLLPSETLQWDKPFEPELYYDWMQDQLQQNNGWGIIDGEDGQDMWQMSESGNEEIMWRINNIETFLGGLNQDTDQSNATDWGTDIGDDGMTGTGEANGVPDGYGPVEITICEDGNTLTMNVLGTTPAQYGVYPKRSNQHGWLLIMLLESKSN